MRTLVAAAIVLVGALTAALTAFPGQNPNLTGTWSGTGSDFWVNQNRFDGMRVTLELSQSSTILTGNVTSTNLNGNDSSCSSCHRRKGGTVSGTVNGNALTMTITFPGIAGEITPDCSISYSGTASNITASDITLAYSGSDSCEGPFTNGTLMMAPGPQAAPSIVSQPLSQAVTSGRAATLGVTTPGTPPISYQWFRGASGVTGEPLAGATSRTYVTDPVTAVTRYWVRASNYYGAVDSGAAELTLSSFTDGSLFEGVVSVRATHVTELRDRINAARSRADLQSYTYTDATLTAQQTTIRAEHVSELRASLLEVYVALNRPAPTFAHSILRGVPVRRIHIDELRAALLAIE